MSRLHSRAHISFKMITLLVLPGLLLPMICSTRLSVVGTPTSPTTSTLAPPTSPCQVTNDTTYNGFYVDCSRQKISTLPLPEQWIPLGTTSLILAFNSIEHIGNVSFSTIRTPQTLRYLDLSNNEIVTIAPFSFTQFIGLTTLYLYVNKINLDSASLSQFVFRGLYSLTDMDLNVNQNERRTGSYPETFLSDLHNLKSLTLDTFSGDLHFGALFNNTKLLSSLTLCGGMKRITNHSFESLRDVELKSLTISQTHVLSTTEAGAYRYLTSLESYSLFGTAQETRVILESLAPFVNKSMKQLTLQGLNRYYKNSKVYSQNTVITRHMARYLSNICVEKLSLSSNKIFIIESGVLTTPTHSKCLKIIDISEMPLDGEITVFLRIPLLSALESFKYTDGKYGLSMYSIHSTTWIPAIPACVPHVQPLFKSSKQEVVEYVRKHQTHQFQDTVDKQSTDLSKSIINTINGTSVANREIDISPGSYSSQSRLMSKKGSYFFLPRQLKVVILNGAAYNMMKMNSKITFIGANNTEEIHLADNGLSIFTGSVRGLSNLKLLDISHNDGSTMVPDYFHSMPTIMYLNMANMKLDSNFMAELSNLLFYPLSVLKVLDLSDNHLRYLAKETFSGSSQLSAILLSGNRFESLPFSLQHVPNACALDLRRNSLRTISEEDIASLEAHALRVMSFSLKLDGNEFHCGCSSLRFLSWLQRTRIHLDNNGNYSCNSDSGMKTNTMNVKDLDAMWRLCHGVQAFWISLTLTCLMTLGFAFAILLPKLKTQIKAFVLRALWNPFILKRANDYPKGVYVGYSDAEVNLACLKIRPFIEDQLGLSTYVRHRDLLPASDMAESIIEAVYSSWRVLLVVSETFLQDPWSYFLLKASTHAVEAENPGRLVLVVVSNDDEQRSALVSHLPACILQAVREESIIDMTRLGNITYGEEEALETALLDHGD